LAVAKAKTKAKAKAKRSTSSRKLRKSAAKPRTRSKPAAKSSRVKLLSGGNPQIAKADGDAPVQAYIAAMPGWKSALGKRLDAVIVRGVPDVRKAVKWNSPFYGVEGKGWFLALHVFNQFVRVTFFRGTQLEPLPPGPSKVKDVRYYDIREGQFDEARFSSWVTQAAGMPGWLS
jgi:hypothetical protein